MFWNSSEGVIDCSNYHLEVSGCSDDNLEFPWAFAQRKMQTSAILRFTDVKLGIVRLSGIYQGHVLDFRVFN